MKSIVKILLQMMELLLILIAFMFASAWIEGMQPFLTAVGAVAICVVSIAQICKLVKYWNV